MTRPVRLEFEGALYHVTSRGDRREAIFEDDVDRSEWLAVLAEGLDRFQATACAHCLMGNHYHVVMQTHRPNLLRLMRHVNGVCTLRYNRRHGKVGHMLHGNKFLPSTAEKNLFNKTGRRQSLLLADSRAGV